MNGKVAIVTGGARGMGFHFAPGLAAAGAAVLIRDLNGAADAAARLRHDAAQADPIDGDIAVEADMAPMATAALDRFGFIDVLANTAAIFTSLLPTPFEVLSVAERDRIMAVSLELRADA